jgi:hypothetical protein
MELGFKDKESISLLYKNYLFEFMVLEKEIIRLIITKDQSLVQYDYKEKCTNPNIIDLIEQYPVMAIISFIRKSINPGNKKRNPQNLEYGNITLLGTRLFICGDEIH